MSIRGLFGLLHVTRELLQDLGVQALCALGLIGTAFDASEKMKRLSEKVAAPKKTPRA